MKIRALVADDQPIARERLLTLLSEEPDVEVVGTAASGPEAVDGVRRLAPNLVFLDIQMPEMDGMGVVQAIGPDQMPPTIFVTAYDEYAVQAFEVHAVDYLLKPFGRARLQQALSRVRGQLERERDSTMTVRLLAVIDELRGHERSSERLVIKSDGRVTFVEIDRIDWVDAEGNYARVHAGADSHVVRETMLSLQRRLDERFFRIHRSRIVNLSRIREIRIAAGGDYDVILTNGTALGLSRLYKAALQARLAART